MKKILYIVSTILLFTLVACDGEEDVICENGMIEVEGICVVDAELYTTPNSIDDSTADQLLLERGIESLPVTTEDYLSLEEIVNEYCAIDRDFYHSIDSFGEQSVMEYYYQALYSNGLITQEIEDSYNNYIDIYQLHKGIDNYFCHLRSNLDYTVRYMGLFFTHALIYKEEDNFLEIEIINENDSMFYKVDLDNELVYSEGELVVKDRTRAINLINGTFNTDDLIYVYDSSNEYVINKTNETHEIYLYALGAFNTLRFGFENEVNFFEAIIIGDFFEDNYKFFNIENFSGNLPEFFNLIYHQKYESSDTTISFGENYNNLKDDTVNIQYEVNITGHTDWILRDLLVYVDCADCFVSTSEKEILIETLDTMINDFGYYYFAEKYFLSNKFMTDEYGQVLDILRDYESEIDEIALIDDQRILIDNQGIVMYKESEGVFGMFFYSIFDNNLHDVCTVIFDISNEKITYNNGPPMDIDFDESYALITSNPEADLNIAVLEENYAMLLSVDQIQFGDEGYTDGTIYSEDLVLLMLEMDVLHNNQRYSLELFIEKSIYVSSYSEYFHLLYVENLIGDEQNIVEIIENSVFENINFEDLDYDNVILLVESLLTSYESEGYDFYNIQDFFTKLQEDEIPQ